MSSLPPDGAVPTAGEASAPDPAPNIDTAALDEPALIPPAGLVATLLVALWLVAGAAVVWSPAVPGGLRPSLVLWAAAACTAADDDAGDCSAGAEQQAWEAAAPAAVAVEMIHAYSLVHDDLPAMDDDDLRRGQPTCHKKFGEAMAILVGDALLTLSFETIAKNYPDSLAGACCLELARAAGPSGMVGGQVADLAAEGRIADASAPTTLDDLEALHRRKTGQLIVASLRLGALVGSGCASLPETRKCLEDLTIFGESLGLAFQIIDDLLDVSGSAEKTGKKVGKDAARGKLTYPGLLGIDESRKRADRLSNEAVSVVSAWGGAGAGLISMANRLLNRES